MRGTNQNLNVTVFENDLHWTTSNWMEAHQQMDWVVSKNNEFLQLTFKEVCALFTVHWLQIRHQTSHKMILIYILFQLFLWKRVRKKPLNNLIIIKLQLEIRRSTFKINLYKHKKLIQLWHGVRDRLQLLDVRCAPSTTQIEHNQNESKWNNDGTWKMICTFFFLFYGCIQSE